MFPLQKKRFRAYVVFQGATHRRFWRIFTRRGWRHVWMIIPFHYPNVSMMAKRYSIKIEPTVWGVDYDIYYQSPDELVKLALDGGATCVISMMVDAPPKRGYIPRGLSTCVTVIKASLGVSWWSAFTPYALAVAMLRNGGQLEGLTDERFRKSFRRRQKAGTTATRARPGTGQGAASVGATGQSKRGGTTP